MDGKHHTVNILAVDDQPANLLVLEDIFKNENWNLVRASSGNEALAHLLDLSFACILCDVKMPDMDGFELAKLLRNDEATRRLPILFVSAHKKELKDVILGYELGAVDYLTKPLDPIVVRSKVAVFADLYLKDLERQEAEQALRASEKLTRSILENANEAFVAMDQNGVITNWNAAAERTFGWASAEVMGKSMAKILIPEHLRDAHNEGMTRFLETGRPKIMYRRMELTALHKDGHEFPIEISISDVASRQGVTFYGLIHDITERKHARELLEQRVSERTKQLAAEKRKLERSNLELEQFASVAAHDLRSPLVSMRGWLDMLDSLLPQPREAELDQAIEFIRLNAKNSVTLIEDLLEVARLNISTDHVDKIDLNNLLVEIQSLLREVIESNQAVITVDKLPEIKGIRSHLSSLFINLINNALTYRDKSRQLRIEVGCKKSEHFYEFAVKDNGIGIEKEYQTKIFGMFQRLYNPDEVPGTGIGLAYCKKVVELWGGEIWVESSKGIGSTFYFKYPIPSCGGNAL